MFNKEKDFASMDEGRVREIARKGGESSRQQLEHQGYVEPRYRGGEIRSRNYDRNNYFYEDDRERGFSRGNYGYNNAGCDCSRRDDEGYYYDDRRGGSNRSDGSRNYGEGRGYHGRNSHSISNRSRGQSAGE